MIRAAFAIAFLAAAAPVAAQNSYPAYHPAQPRNDFERCIVAAWTAAVARRQVRGTSYGGDVGTWTALGDDGRLVVRARYGAQSGRWEVHVDATTTITGLEAVTVFRGDERVGSMFPSINRVDAPPTGLDRDIALDFRGTLMIQDAAETVLGVYQPAARACLASAQAAAPAS